MPTYIMEESKRVLFVDSLFVVYSGCSKRRFSVLAILGGWLESTKCSHMNRVWTCGGMLLVDPTPWGNLHCMHDLNLTRNHAVNRVNTAPETCSFKERLGYLVYTADCTERHVPSQSSCLVNEKTSECKSIDYGRKTGVSA